jgi:cytoskeletal protein CcmA (bactofilin family)
MRKIFNQKEAKMADVDTIIGSNVEIQGALKNLGSIEVNGKVDGEIHSGEDVLIGETAKIKGPVVAKNITVAGEVNGTLEAQERVEIVATGRVFGDISTKILIVQQGAKFIGKSNMPESEKKPHRGDEAMIDLGVEESTKKH